MSENCLVRSYVFDSSLGNDVRIQCKDNSSNPEGDDFFNADFSDVVKIELFIDKDEDSPYSSEDHPNEITWTNSGVIILKLGTILAGKKRALGYFKVYYDGILLPIRFGVQKIEFIVV